MNTNNSTDSRIAEVTREIRSLSEILPASTSKINNYSSTAEAFELLSCDFEFVRVTDHSIELCEHNITDKIISENSQFENQPSNRKWSHFLTELGDSFIRLNHLGVSYSAHDLDQEISFYKKIISKKNICVYEEHSDDPNSRWIFVGNTFDWQAPLFEIVLTKKYESPENIWRPHFQVDIDTDLSPTNLNILLEKCFGKDFVQWKLDVPNYGVVLMMGMVGSINGTKIYLGAGTNLRNTKYHREQILKKI